MRQPAISIIVPVYNAEAFLSRCVDSLLAQTLRDIEVVLVDDGSTDSSKTICEQYAVEDNRVRVISQPNRGVAMARQAGVDVASGIYSIHADPDDWVEHTMLEELYTKAIEENADMVICDFMIDFANRNYVASQRVGKCEPEDCLNRMMRGKIHGSLCNKLIRTVLYKEHNIRFFDGINYCEDYLTCVQLFIRGVKIAYIPKPFYHYDQVVNNNSATRRYTKETLQTQFRFYGKLCEILNGRQRRALAHVISLIAFDSYYYDILTPAEFSEFFCKYRRKFFWSKYKFKRRMALYLAALGLMKFARKIHK